jgi:hypothetical protein
MTRHPTDHLDNRRLAPVLHRITPDEAFFVIHHPWMARYWRGPENASEIIAANKIDNDLQRVVLAHELNRLEKRNGF